MEAALGGFQRKVVHSAVRPVRAGHGSRGIPLRGKHALPFVVQRSWSAPAGHYDEAWYLVDPTTREVFYESTVREVRIWGLQSWTEISDTVTEAVALAQGDYLVVFALGGVKGGEAMVAAFEAVEDAA